MIKNKQTKNHVLGRHLVTHDSTSSSVILSLSARTTPVTIVKNHTASLRGHWNRRKSNGVKFPTSVECETRQPVCMTVKQSPLPFHCGTIHLVLSVTREWLNLYEVQILKEENLFPAPEITKVVPLGPRGVELASPVASGGVGCSCGSQWGAASQDSSRCCPASACPGTRPRVTCGPWYLVPPLPAGLSWGSPNPPAAREGHWESMGRREGRGGRVRVDPWTVQLADPGALGHRVTELMGSHRGACLLVQSALTDPPATWTQISSRNDPHPVDRD